MHPDAAYQCICQQRIPLESAKQSLAKGAVSAKEHEILVADRLKPYAQEIEQLKLDLDQERKTILDLHVKISEIARILGWEEQ